MPGYMTEAFREDAEQRHADMLKRWRSKRLTDAAVAIAAGVTGADDDFQWFAPALAKRSVEIAKAVLEAVDKECEP